MPHGSVECGGQARRCEGGARGCWSEHWTYSSHVHNTRARVRATLPTRQTHTVPLGLQDCDVWTLKLTQHD